MAKGGAIVPPNLGLTMKFLAILATAFLAIAAPVAAADTFDIGGSYSMGHMTFALAWSHGEYKQLDNNTDSLDHIQLSASRWLGEGVQLGAMVGLFDYDDEGVADSDNTGWQTAIGIIMFL